MPATAGWGARCRVGNSKCPFHVGQIITRKADGLVGIATEIPVPCIPGEFLIFRVYETSILGNEDVEKWEDMRAVHGSSEQDKAKDQAERAACHRP